VQKKNIMLLWTMVRNMYKIYDKNDYGPLIYLTLNIILIKS